LPLQPGDCTIKRAGTEPRPTHALDFIDHGIPMPRSTRQASEDQQRRIGELFLLYYVSRTITHDVIVAQEMIAVNILGTCRLGDFASACPFSRCVREVRRMRLLAFCGNCAGDRSVGMKLSATLTLY
jgi:hypothetical protein